MHVSLGLLYSLFVWCVFERYINTRMQYNTDLCWSTLTFFVKRFVQIIGLFLI